MKSTKNLRQYVMYVVINCVLIGMGMGVPVGSILLGGVLGSRYGLKRQFGKFDRQIVRQLIIKSGIEALITLLIMIVIWGPTVAILAEPARVANFGHPYILYDPLLSYFGWLVLMIVVSPFLQFLLAVTAGVSAMSLGEQNESNRHPIRSE